MLYRASDDPILPFGFEEYGHEVNRAYLHLRGMYWNHTLNDSDIVAAFGYLSNAVDTFGKLAERYDYYLSGLRKENLYVSQLKRR